MSISTSYGVGQYRASEAHCISRRSDIKTATGVIWGHGMLHTPAVDATTTHRFIGDSLAAAGLISLITDLGGTATFGNDTSQTACDDAVTYLATAGAAAGDYFLAASSMGAMTVLAHARDNLSDVIAIALAIPAVDAQDVYANDRGGLASDIDAAYGGDWAASEATHNPINFADDLASIPIAIWSSSDDDIIVPATVTAFAAAHGNTTLFSMGAVGHTLNAATTVAMGQWLRARIT